MIQLQEDSVVYVACPGNVATGGPELLHQMVHKLTLGGARAKVYYYTCRDRERPTPAAYVRYGTEHVLEIEDHPRNVLVVPEIAGDLLMRNRRTRAVMWWLSVDNYYKETYVSRAYWRRRLAVLLRRHKYYLEKHQARDVTHFYQSEYARRFLAERGIQEKGMYPLSDYLNAVYVEGSEHVEYSRKEDIVLYNPLKGVEFTRKVMSRTPELTWIALAGMTPAEVLGWVQRAKVYVDFGEHPGKDRFPREAAINGCVVLTSRFGAARFHEDIPIPGKYKFDAVDANIAAIGASLADVMRNYRTLVDDFGEYRAVIARQEMDFERDLWRIFGK
jgi:hypothetical protein